MADTRSITITLKLDKSGDNEADTTNQTGSTSETKSNDKGSQAKAIAAYAATQLGSMAVSELSNWAEYYWNRELTLSDDYIAQRSKQIALTQINRTVNMMTTIGSSTAQGAMTGGWVGAIVGLLLGTTQVVSGVVRSNVQGQDQQNIRLKQMDAQLQFTRSRAGWSTHAASIGEDL